MTVAGRSLAGRSIVVCRATGQAGPLLERLTELGAHPIHVPLIETIEPVDGGAELRRALSSTDASTWLAFTSVNGVDAVASALDGAPVGRIAVVGASTAERVESFGWPIAEVAGEPSAAGLAATLPAGPGDRVVAPLAELASSDLADGLRAKGIDVEVVTAYRTVIPEVSAADLVAVAKSDAVLITAPSVIQRLSNLVDPANLPPLIAIGRTSAAATRSLGLSVAAQATEPTVDGLIAAVVRTLGP